jgi:hypothetical protein
MIYMQTMADPKVWEEVDEYTFTHWTIALGVGGPRYTGNYARQRENKHFDFRLQDVATEAVGAIMRFFQIQPLGGSMPNGFIRSPEFIMFCDKGRKPYLHQMGGENFHQFGKKVA